jgi:hypothetical protein
MAHDGIRVKYGCRCATENVYALERIDTALVLPVLRPSRAKLSIQCARK